MAYRIRPVYMSEEELSKLNLPNFVLTWGNKARHTKLLVKEIVLVFSEKWFQCYITVLQILKGVNSKGLFSIPFRRNRSNSTKSGSRENSLHGSKYFIYWVAYRSQVYYSVIKHPLGLNTLSENCLSFWWSVRIRTNRPSRTSPT